MKKKKRLYQYNLIVFTSTIKQFSCFCTWIRKKNRIGASLLYKTRKEKKETTREDLVPPLDSKTNCDFISHSQWLRTVSLQSILTLLLFSVKLYAKHHIVFQPFYFNETRNNTIEQKNGKSYGRTKANSQWKEKRKKKWRRFFEIKVRNQR